MLQKKKKRVNLLSTFYEMKKFTLDLLIFIPHISTLFSPLLLPYVTNHTLKLLLEVFYLQYLLFNHLIKDIKVFNLLFDQLIKEKKFICTKKVSYFISKSLLLDSPHREPLRNYNRTLFQAAHHHPHLIMIITLPNTFPALQWRHQPHR